MTDGRRGNFTKGEEEHELHYAIHRVKNRGGPFRSFQRVHIADSHRKDNGPEGEITVNIRSYGDN